MSGENGEGHVAVVPPLNSVLDVEAPASGDDAGKARTTKRNRVRQLFESLTK